MAQYLIVNGPSPTIAAQVPVTTGTAIKTLLQVVPSATLGMRVKEWGISFDGYAPALPIRCELLETDVAATITAHVAAGIVKWDQAALMGGDPTTNLIQVGSAVLTGYTATAEGTITATRMFDPECIAPTNQYVKQFPLGLEPWVQTGKYLRIRVTAAAPVLAYCYVLVEV